MKLISPLRTDADLERLRVGLAASLAHSGMPLPEDENILEYVSSAMQFGSMRAVLAVQAGEAVGVAAWRAERDAGFVALLFVLPDAPSQAAPLLLAAAQRDLAGQALRAIYVELPGVSAAVRAALAAAGFVGVARTIMQCDLHASGLQPAPLAAGYRLRPWDETCVKPAADVIYQANIGTLDAMIIPELQSLAGTLRIVGQVQQGRYGLFDAPASGVVLEEDGAVVGVTLVTRRYSGLGFTAEISIRASHRRRGLARGLMLHTHAALHAAGIVYNTLGVTAGNPARRLYEALGYVPVGGVWAFVNPRPAGWPD